MLGENPQFYFVCVCVCVCVFFFSPLFLPFTPYSVSLSFPIIFHFIFSSPLLAAEVFLNPNPPTHTIVAHTSPKKLKIVFFKMMR